MRRIIGVVFYTIVYTVFFGAMYDGMFQDFKFMDSIGIMHHPKLKEADK